MGKNGTRITIGLLVSGIVDSYTEYICRGTMRAAKKADVNLIVIPGKYINRDLEGNREITYEYQYNTLFSYAANEEIDALIIAADCIGCLTTRDNVIKLLEEYKDIPTILVASKIDGYISVNYDNGHGVREGLEYIINHLHCRRIGMIGGPDDNTDAFERKQVFLEVLEEYGIPFEDKLYVESDLGGASIYIACERILDDNPDIEAIFCVNDGIAMGLYDEMKKRNLVPGKDIKVFGYDDDIAAAKAKPSLSSVYADPADLGERAVYMALDKLSGRDITSEILETKLIKRNSLREVTEGSEEEYSRLLSEEYVDEYFDGIFYRCKYRDVDKEVFEMRDLFKTIMQKIFALSQVESELNKEVCERVLNLFDVFLRYDSAKYADIDNMVAYYEQVYRAIKDRVRNMEARYRIGKVFTGIYKKIIYTLDYHIGVLEHDNYGVTRAMKMFVRDILRFDKGNDQSYAVVMENLEWLNIHNAYLYTFEEPIIHLYKEKFKRPEEYYLKATLVRDKVQSIPPMDQKKSFSEIFSNDEMNQERHSLVMLPLFFNEMNYGFILCDMTDDIYENGDFLPAQISSAVKMIVTLRTNEIVQQQLEENLAALKENNIKLDNLSKSDMLTGILNRRGFYDMAERLLQRNQSNRKRTLVAYIDMNNLKIINDRYGHDEGDFSLKLIGDLVVETVGDKGVVGRIGGDEFACVMTYETSDNGLKLVNDIANRFADFNVGSDKPYNVTVSTGACVLDGAQEVGLQEALSMADEKLYIAKQSRVKVVAKEEAS
ncbi:MAG: GGDEF domain-containing protein [Lachnospiraceae bacterium]|nr:GGDEF domain-containing protein [Lachnospiraceae bacterium]